MPRIAASPAELALSDYRRRFVPLASTLVAMLLAALPIVATSPILPDFGFLVLLSWRLLRHELWTARAALVFGLVADLVSGHPLGQSMLLFTAVFLALDLVDLRLGFRDYWMEWLVAAAAIIFQTAGAWYIALLMGADVRFAILLPQLGLSVLAWPVVARIVLGLDRWRLS